MITSIRLPINHKLEKSSRQSGVEKKIIKTKEIIHEKCIMKEEKNEIIIIQSSHIN